MNTISDCNAFKKFEIKPYVPADEDSFGWSLPYPEFKDPDEELDEKWGSNEDYNRYKKICYNYGIQKHRLVTYRNLPEVYGKTYEELNEAEKAAYEWVEYRLEDYFEVCLRSF